MTSQKREKAPPVVEERRDQSLFVVSGSILRIEKKPADGFRKPFSIVVLSSIGGYPVDGEWRVVENTIPIAVNAPLDANPLLRQGAWVIVQGRVGGRTSGANTFVNLTAERISGPPGSVGDGAEEDEVPF